MSADNPDPPEKPPTLQRGFPLTFWLSLAFCGLCIAAGAAVAWLGPHWR